MFRGSDSVTAMMMMQEISSVKDLLSEMALQIVDSYSGLEAVVSLVGSQLVAAVLLGVEMEHSS